MLSREQVVNTFYQNMKMNFIEPNPLPGLNATVNMHRSRHCSNKKVSNGQVYDKVGRTALA